MTESITYQAHFTPEAWIRDNAVEVDAEGPQEWDCTAFATEHAAYVAKMLAWSTTCPGEFTDMDDVFQEDPAAPDWVRNWQGPFTIIVQRVLHGND